MFRLMELLENAFGAVAFAEAGERETALGLLGRSGSVGEPGYLEDVFAAATFAQANMREEVLRDYSHLFSPDARPRRMRDFLRDVGVPPSRVWYAQGTFAA